MLCSNRGWTRYYIPTHNRMTEIFEILIEFSLLKNTVLYSALSVQKVLQSRMQVIVPICTVNERMRKELL